MLTQPHVTQQSVRYLKGIGPKRVEAFKKFGVETLADLFYFFPRKYEDRSQLKPIRDVRIGEAAVIRGKVIGKSVRTLKALKLFELFVEDASSQIAAVWFNQPYHMNTFNEGDEVILSGKVEFRNRMQLTNPEYEIVKDEDTDVIQAGRIVPIYPLTEGLAQRALRVSMKELAAHYVEHMEEFLPKDFLAKQKLMGLQEALLAVHFPDDQNQLDRARYRFIFEELFLFELVLLHDIAVLKSEAHGLTFRGIDEAIAKFKASLPFALTADQENVLSEIQKDISTSKPMTRLLQGEVGSGKTVVAVAALVAAFQNGYQAAFMAPTEVLAEQQYRSIKQLLKPFGIKAALLIGSLTPDEKTQIHADMKKGNVNIVVGTHALLQEQIQFKQLGLVIIDEQHKFGVRQRNALLQGDPRPHLLVMTATPIPRTLGLTLFGDLDISTIRELPKGRKPVKTYWVSKKKEKDMWNFVGQKAREGKQAYVVCPRIEDDEEAGIQSVVEQYETLSRGALKEFCLGLVHGKVLKEERDRVMQKFREGKIQVLVSTSMIEVGLDNPNATVMVVHDAERFGLAQLHQMRGRVGRGSEESFCFLIGDPAHDESRRRLRILTKTTDGFQIAEEDLKLRGPGDFLGTRQSGMPWFRLAEFPRDLSIMIKAREAANRLIQEDLHFYSEKHARLRDRFIQYQSMLEKPV